MSKAVSSICKEMSSMSKTTATAYDGVHTRISSNQKRKGDDDLGDSCPSEGLAKRQCPSSNTDSTGPPLSTTVCVNNNDSVGNLCTIGESIKPEEEATPRTNPEACDAQFEEDYEHICEVHPNIDQVYIREQLTLHVKDPQRVSTVVFNIFSLEDPPTREYREALEAVKQEYNRLNNISFDLEVFIKKYPNPEATFSDENMDITEIYYDYALVFLKNHFNQLNEDYVQEVLDQCKFHLTPAFNILNTAASRYEEVVKGKRTKRRAREIKTKYLITPRTEVLEYPIDRTEIDEDFFWERLYVLNQQQILGHLAAKKAAREQCLEQAKLEGRLHECDICLNSEVLQEDTISCPEDHLYCSNCVKRSTEELLGLGRATFPCLNPECEAKYTLKVLERVLDQKTFNSVVSIVQTEELRMADIKNLVSCPFCPYAVVYPDNLTSSIFHCENPACMQDSCRLCKAVAHIPLTCAEFKKKTNYEYERFMENEMAEAMIRQCPKCGLRFVKEAGSCNKMHCNRCGTTTCYACKRDITRDKYSHFGKNSRCYKIIDPGTLHRDEVTKAFRKAPDNYKEAHPDLFKNDSIKLTSYNPIETLKI